MTDNEINAKIAEMHRWKFHPTRKVWKRTDDRGFDRRSYGVPDYLHSWELAGTLLEEIPGAVLARDGEGKWYCGYGYSNYIDASFDDGWSCSDFEGEADTPQRAICMAYLKVKGVE